MERLRGRLGAELGVSDWLEVTQVQVDGFAEATGDRQWLHVDQERARKGPFGRTIAHGYLTLSLLPALLAGVLTAPEVTMAVNYGLNRVRFPAPVRVGSRVRARAVMREVAPVEGGVQVVLAVTVELEGSSKPACVAETVTRLYTEPH